MVDIKDVACVRHCWSGYSLRGKYNPFRGGGCDGGDGGGGGSGGSGSGSGGGVAVVVVVVEEDIQSRMMVVR